MNRQSPQWTPDGEPANDAAAIADALEWLIALRGLLNARLAADNVAREHLERCIAELRKRLPADYVAEVEKRRT